MIDRTRAQAPSDGKPMARRRFLGWVAALGWLAGAAWMRRLGAYPDIAAAKGAPAQGPRELSLHEADLHRPHALAG